MELSYLFLQKKKISNVHFVYKMLILCMFSVRQNKLQRLNSNTVFSGASVELKTILISKTLQESRQGATVTRSHDKEATGGQNLAVNFNIAWIKHSWNEEAKKVKKKKCIPIAECCATILHGVLSCHKADWGPVDAELERHACFCKSSEVGLTLKLCTAALLI